MASRKRRLTESMVKSEPVPRSGSSWLWDTDVKGFGLRVRSSGARSFVLRYGGGRRESKRRLALGQYGEITLDQARKLAIRMWGAIHEGRDPAIERQRERGVPTLTVFAEQYMRDHAEKHKRPASIRGDRVLLDRHLLPLLGSRPLDKVTRGDMARLQRRLRDKPTMCNRALALLSHMYTMAYRWAVLEEAVNPARGIERRPERKRQRYLSPAELARVGAALASVKASPQALAAIRVMLLTGARPGEVRGLLWDNLDLAGGTARLVTRKRGSLSLVLPPSAVAVLRSLPHVKDNPYVFASRLHGKHLTESGVWQVWRKVLAAAGITDKDAVLYITRHTFGAVLTGRGEGLPITGGILGHTQPSTTQRYAHVADDPMRVAADGAAEEIEGALKRRDAS